MSLPSSPPRLLPLTPSCYAHASGALWLPHSQSLLIADAHLGYGWAQRRRGELGPVLDGGASSALHDLCAELQPRRLIFLGDLVHAPRPAPQERRLIESTLTSLARLADLIVVPGNHDRLLHRDFPTLPLTLTPSLLLEGMLALHGHQIPAPLDSPLTFPLPSSSPPEPTSFHHPTRHPSDLSHPPSPLTISPSSPPPAISPHHQSHYPSAHLSPLTPSSPSSPEATSASTKLHHRPAHHSSPSEPTSALDKPHPPFDPHHPVTPCPSSASQTTSHSPPNDPSSPSLPFLLLGHLHPVLRFTDAAGATATVRVFLLSEHALVLPAFSPYAAGHSIHKGLPATWQPLFPRAQAELIAVTGNQVRHLGLFQPLRFRPEPLPPPRAASRR